MFQGGENIQGEQGGIFVVPDCSGLQLSGRPIDTGSNYRNPPLLTIARQ